MREEPLVRITGRQIKILNDIINVYDPPFVDIESTNLKGVVLFSYNYNAEMMQVLVSADGHTMEVG